MHTPTTKIYTLSLHDALRSSKAPDAANLYLNKDSKALMKHAANMAVTQGVQSEGGHADLFNRSEEHTSELQSPCNLVCRLLLEKKNERMAYQWKIWIRRFNN